ncbi:MAG TPA: HAD family phosphatase [Solirubrobacteraceae bacterium]
MIFDCDGVLVDSEGISTGVLAQLLTQAGVPTSAAESRRTYQGMMMDQITEHASQRLGRPLPDGFPDRFVAQREVEFRARLEPVAGAAEAVRRVRDAGIGVCVASQGTISKTELTLGLTGLRGLFDDGTLFSSYSVARGKPHPDVFLHAAEVMGSTPSETVVVEDSPSGVTAALSAGMRAYRYLTDGDDPRPEDCVEMFRSMYDLPALIGLAADR